MMGALSPGLKRHSVSLFEGALVPSPGGSFRTTAWRRQQSYTNHVDVTAFLHAFVVALPQTRCVRASGWCTKPNQDTCCSGGRVTGVAAVAELIRELHSSVEASDGFEGEMVRVSDVARCAAQRAGPQLLLRLVPPSWANHSRCSAQSLGRRQECQVHGGAASRCETRDSRQG